MLTLPLKLGLVKFSRVVWEEWCKVIVRNSRCFHHMVDDVFILILFSGLRRYPEPYSTPQDEGHHRLIIQVALLGSALGLGSGFALDV